MDTDKLPSQELLSQLLDYDPDTGILTWKRRKPEHFPPIPRFDSVARANIWNGRNAGKTAFSRVNAKGYCVGKVCGISVSAHRVIWKMVHGEEAPSVDHEDGNGINNRLLNLRSATPSEQSKNTKTPKSNTSGEIGVTASRGFRWKAQIGVGGKKIYLGVFDSIADAKNARREAATFFGFHKNHGRQTANEA